MLMGPESGFRSRMDCEQAVAFVLRMQSEQLTTFHNFIAVANATFDKLGIV